MSFLAVLVCVVAFVLVFKDALRKLPILFYVLAFVLAGVYAATGFYDFSVDFKLLLFFLMQKGTLATALFVVVMYMGVFRDVGFVKHRLMPVRATLSIIACILILGHIVKYCLSFASALGSTTLFVQVGIMLGMLAFWLMIPLGITSLQVVKRRMTSSAWISLQKWSYVFYALVYVHLACLLAPSALSVSSGSSAESLLVYTLVFGLYGILRVAKALRDKQATRSECVVEASPDEPLVPELDAQA